MTTMVLKVDLQCSSCHKQVKKILYKFPQIRDQVFDEKSNTVTITVFCCNPERIRDKLCCKGANVIKSILIKEPEKPNKPSKGPEPEKPISNKSSKGPAPEKPNKPIVDKPSQSPEPEKPKKPVMDEAKPPKGPHREPCSGLAPRSWGTCCMECYHGYSGGPCFSGYGYGAPNHGYGPGAPGPWYDGYGCQSQYYLNDENPHGCSIM